MTPLSFNHCPSNLYHTRRPSLSRPHYCSHISDSSCAQSSLHWLAHIMQSFISWSEDSFLSISDMFSQLFTMWWWFNHWLCHDTSLWSPVWIKRCTDTVQSLIEGFQLDWRVMLRLYTHITLILAYCKPSTYRLRHIPYLLSVSAIMCTTSLSILDFMAHTPPSVTILVLS